MANEFFEGFPQPTESSAGGGFLDSLRTNPNLLLFLGLALKGIGSAFNPNKKDDSDPLSMLLQLAQLRSLQEKGSLETQKLQTEQGQATASNQLAGLLSSREGGMNQPGNPSPLDINQFQALALRGGPEFARIALSPELLNPQRHQGRLPSNLPSPERITELARAVVQGFNGGQMATPPGMTALPPIGQEPSPTLTPASSMASPTGVASTVSTSTGQPQVLPDIKFTVDKNGELSFQVGTEITKLQSEHVTVTDPETGKTQILQRIFNPVKGTTEDRVVGQAESKEAVQQAEIIARNRYKLTPNSPLFGEVVAQILAAKGLPAQDQQQTLIALDQTLRQLPPAIRRVPQGPPLPPPSPGPAGITKQSQITQSAPSTTTVLPSFEDITNKAQQRELADKLNLFRMQQEISQTFPEKVSPTERQKFAGEESSLNQLATLKSLFNPDSVGPVAGRLLNQRVNFGRDITGQAVTSDDAKFIAQLRALQNAVIHDITGAQLGEKEAQRILAQLPSESNPATVFEAKLELSTSNLKQLTALQQKNIPQGKQQQGQSKIFHFDNKGNPLP